MERSLEKWLDDAPRLECDWASLERDLPAQPRRPGGAAVLAGVAARPLPAGRRPALVHDHVRARQHLHQPAGAAVQRRARGDDPDGARPLAGRADRRLSRRGPGPHPARAALRRADRLRGAAALALLRGRRRDAAVRGAPRRVRALDRRHAARARPRADGARRPRLDRRLRRPAGQRLRRLQAAQREDRPREPVLEGLLGLDLLPRRPPAGVPAGDLRAAGLRLRRQGARRPPGARGLERPGLRRAARDARPPSSSGASTATSGSKTASTSRWPSTATAPRSTRSPRTSATCCGAASSTRTRPSASCATS